MSSHLVSIYPEMKLNLDKSGKERVYEFEQFRLDASNLMLYRDGAEVQLVPKAVQTLLVLVERRGEIVSKDELIDAIWSNVVVGESNLTQYLYLLRKTLGQTSDGKPFIETFRRRGYRFNGAVISRQSSSTHAAPDGSRLTVERYGNVLKLADWREPDIRNEIVPVTPPASTEQRRSYAWIAGFAAAALMLIAFGVYLKFGSVSNVVSPTASARNEISMVRLTNGGAPQDVAISPDGKYFAYHEPDGEISRMWVQQTGLPTRIEIVQPSKRTILQKTFSPDGTAIYFIARDASADEAALYRVPTIGGTVSEILNGISSPVSFSPDGKELVFGRIDRASGASELVITSDKGQGERTLLKREKGESAVSNPAWSRDGQLIAFVTAPNNAAQSAGYRVSTIEPKTGVIRDLSNETWDTCYRLAWAADGVVLVGTRQGDSYTTRRDQIYYVQYPAGSTRRLTTNGSRHQVGSLAVTLNDEIIAVPNDRSSQIWRMDANGDVSTAVQVSNGSADGRPGLAPLSDGRVAYIARIGEALNVWLTDSSGRDPRQLFGEPQFVEELRAPPDGSFFVFSSVIDNRNHLFRVEADGSGLRQLTFGDSSEIDSTISPDGKWVVYDSVRNDSGSQKRSLWKREVSGNGDPVLVSEQECFASHFSPDGNFLSCVYQEKEILVISVASGEVVKRFDAVKIATLNTGARWTPDGKALIYPVQQKGISNLWRQNIAGGPATQFTSFTSGDIYNLAYSPDGTKIFLSRGHQIRDAILIKDFK